MKKFVSGMVGLVALIALSGSVKAYDMQDTYSKTKELTKKAQKTLQPCSDTNPIFPKCEE